MIRNFAGIITASYKLIKVCEQIEKVATTDATILVTGESGTGKELVARAIHKLSKRSGNFISINCAAIPDDILESELFGYVKGAFTGAFNSREGKFQAANKGTLFLDEIGEMSLRLQAKLLRVIQDKTVQKLGSNVDEQVDVRIVAATNKNLRDEVVKGNFREDLLYRLEVVHFELPPLRERKEDISVLAHHFLEKFKSKYSKNISMSQSFIEPLKMHEFRGNVRELQNIIERAVLLCDSPELTSKDLPAYVLKNIDVKEEYKTDVCDKKELQTFNLDFDRINLVEFLTNIEKEIILRALEKAGGNKTVAAEMLNVNRTTLIEKIKRLCKEAA